MNKYLITQIYFIIKLPIYHLHISRLTIDLTNKQRFIDIAILINNINVNIDIYIVPLLTK